MLHETLEPLAEERRALLRFAKHLCRDNADADDLVQEALLRLWRHQPTFPSAGHRRAWLKRVVLNGHIDGRRRSKRTRDWLARNIREEPTVPTTPMTTQMSTSLQRHLAALPFDYRNVLLAVDVNEASYQEAAEELNCPIGTVMSRLHRARRQLRERIAQAPASSPVTCAGKPPAALVSDAHPRAA